MTQKKSSMFIQFFLSFQHNREKKFSRTHIRVKNVERMDMTSLDFLMGKWNDNLQSNRMKMTEEANCEITGECEMYETVCEQEYQCTLMPSGRLEWTKNSSADVLEEGKPSNRCAPIPVSTQAACGTNRCYRQSGHEEVHCHIASGSPVMPDSIIPNDTMTVSNEEAGHLMPCGYYPSMGGNEIILGTSSRHCETLNSFQYSASYKKVVDSVHAEWRINSQNVAERCAANDCSPD